MPYAQPLRPGDPERLGAYEIVGRLGEGGQGTVYLGMRPDTAPEPYAVKVLHGRITDEREAFLREVGLAKQVARFCTAQVIDAGLADDRPYIVSEFVDGPSLHREVAVGGPRRDGALERLAIGTATALTAIHRAGIVHRDFKPQNVLLGPDGPRVIDFGLARALDAAATQSGRGAGTPAYMAPEQVEGAEIDPAADVFSWGATMCFAANAQAPFGQDSIAAVLHRILTAEPELGDLDGWLAALVAVCLDKDPRNRPTSRELLLTLLGDGDGAEPGESGAGLTAEPGGGRPAAGADGSGPAAGADGSGPAAGADGGVAAGPGGSGERGEERSLRAGAASVRPVSGPVSIRSVSARPFPAAAIPAGALPAPWEAGAVRSLSEEEPAGTRTHPGRAATRASMAVSGSLLVSAAVLVGVLVPALSGNGGPIGGGRTPVPPTESGPSSVLAERVETSAESGPLVPRREHRTVPARNVSGAGGPATVPAGGVAVPPVAGLERSEARRVLEDAGLAAGSVVRADSAEPIGRVLGSVPEARTVVARGTRVRLRISAGVPVPDLTGLRRKAAGDALRAAGLGVGAVTALCSDRPSGQVLATSPGAGERISSGGAVAMTVARRGAAVPSVVGAAEADARGALTAAGFAVRTRARPVDGARAGTVLAQSAGPGGCVRPGVTVVITVGVGMQSGPGPGEEPTPAPDPGGPAEPTSTAGAAIPGSVEVS
ncbi:PASTA domain-containing protein [Planomonospora sp. ID82291]|uniref:protein kinase domain-containing protein n=1 Tax=Planomonospora sp. ID82291 TaxID=2738136 RepID=UPI0018C38256|nr:PASTA domain-containing protein [Planomonospora sp. ID82291]MBG0815821.1 PASTA domain-containing protein [Planomonospora sp. ID82291]